MLPDFMDLKIVFKIMEESLIIPGMEVCPEIIKTSLLGVSLAFLIGRYYIFGSLSDCSRIFPEPNPPENEVLR